MAGVRLHLSETQGHSAQARADFQRDFLTHLWRRQVFPPSSFPIT